MVSKNALDLLQEIKDFISIDFDVITADDNYEVKQKNVVTLSVGVDHIKTTDSSTGRIISMPHLNKYSVAEYVLFYLIKHFAKFDQRHDRSFTNMNLSQSSYGIIGLGQIGSVIKTALESFNCKVMWANNKNDYELLYKCKCLIICCPLTKDTEGMVNKDFLSCFSDLELIVNISRPNILIDKEIPDKIHLIQDFITDIPNSTFTNHIAGRTKTVKNEMIYFLKAIK